MEPWGAVQRDKRKAEVPASTLSATRVVYVYQSTVCLLHDVVERPWAICALQVYDNLREKDRLGNTSTITSAVSASPMAYIPGDHTRSKELMQKKLIVCPISSQEPAN